MSFFLISSSVLVASLLVVLWVITTQPFVVPASSHADLGSDPKVLKSHVETLSLSLPPRSGATADLNAAARYIFDNFSSYGQPEYQTYEIRGNTYRNVILTINGVSDEIIVIGAHYDVHAGLPGADDNASGVAGILELARMLSVHKPPITVVIVAFTLEEAPHFSTDSMGSFQHARQVAASNNAPQLMICLEMIGYFNDESGSQKYPYPLLSSIYSNTGNFIAVIGRLAEISSVRKIKAAFKGNTTMPVHSLTFPPVIPGMTLSDHSNYWKFGINAVMITDTSYERNPNYHTKNDTPDTLDYRRMSEVVNGVFHSVLLLGK